MEDIIRFKLRQRVALVVDVIDDFTGRTVTGSGVRVSAINETVTPIKKSEGYFIFTNCSSEILDICVEAVAYHTETARVHMERLNPLNPVLKIRLKPNRLYTLPREATSIEGRTEAGALIYVVHSNEEDGLKLLYDYDSKTKDSCEISIYNPASIDMEGKEFAICKKDSADFEIFTIAGKACEDGDKYILYEPLKSGYKKASSIIFQVQSAKADRDGNYFIAIKELNKDCAVTLRLLAKKKLQRTVELKPGKKNIVDLL